MMVVRQYITSLPVSLLLASQADGIMILVELFSSYPKSVESHCQHFGAARLAALVVSVLKTNGAVPDGSGLGLLVAMHSVRLIENLLACSPKALDEDDAEHISGHRRAAVSTLDAVRCGVVEALSAALWKHLSLWNLDFAIKCIECLESFLRGAAERHFDSRTERLEWTRHLSTGLAAACTSSNGRLLETLCYFILHSGRGWCFYQYRGLTCAIYICHVIERFFCDDEEELLPPSLALLSLASQPNPTASSFSELPPARFSRAAFRARWRDLGLTAAVMEAAVAKTNATGESEIDAEFSQELSRLRARLMDCLSRLGLGVAEPPRRALPPPPTPPQERSRVRSDVPPSPPPVPSHCANCGREPAAAEPSFKVCSQCKGVRYCGVECSRAAWKAGHKAKCRAAAG